MSSIAINTDTGSARRVALLLPTLETGGAERAVAILAGALVARGEQVDLVVGRVVNGAETLVPEGVRLVELDTRRVLTSFWALRDYLEREKPEALLANLTHANALALLTRRRWKLPVRIVVVEHCTLSVFARRSGALRHRLLPLVARLTYRQADGIVAVSHDARADLSRVLHLPAERTEVVANALPLPGLHQWALEPTGDRWFEAQRAPVLVAAGSLRPVKNFPFLLRAFARLRASRDCRLVILGEGQQRGRLERLVRRLGLSDDVHLPGVVSNVYPWIARSSGVVLTSWTEGLPTVLLEGMALGRPLVAVDCPSGPREILDGGRFGRLVPEGDLPALVAGMTWALDATSTSVPAQVMEINDPAAVAERYLQLLRPERDEAASLAVA